MSKINDLLGQVFGELEVIEFAELRREGERTTRAYWKVRCSCGAETVVNGRDLRRGHTKSCGCLKKKSNPAAVEASTKHGMRNSPEYEAWRAMKKRCLNPRSPNYKRYGGRGISISSDWVGSFDTFYRDMGPRPSDEHSLGRIDNDGPYEKSNCRWETLEEQQNNRSSTVIVTFEGKTLSLTQLDRLIGARYTTSAHYYIQQLGWSVEQYVEMVKNELPESL